MSNSANKSTAPSAELLDFSRLRSSYLYAPMNTAVDPAFSTAVWAPEIDRLLVAGYHFNNCQYSSKGYLYRGMCCGLSAAILNDNFARINNGNEINEVEAVMRVCFLSHEISDAISSSRIHENQPDSAILVFKSSIFNTEFQRRRAAVLAIGDFGMVFRYPFLTRPLMMCELEYIIITPPSLNHFKVRSAALENKLICIDAKNRKAFETQLQQECSIRGIENARPVPCSDYPKMSDFR